MTCSRPPLTASLTRLEPGTPRPKVQGATTAPESAPQIGNIGTISFNNMSYSQNFNILTKQHIIVNTVTILSFRTDRSGQTVQTQIRLLLEEQSDQGIHCLQFQLHLLGTLLFGKPSCLNFRMITANFLGVQIFRIFTVEAP